MSDKVFAGYENVAEIEEQISRLEDLQERVRTLEERLIDECVPEQSDSLLDRVKGLMDSTNDYRETGYGSVIVTAPAYEHGEILRLYEDGLAIYWVETAENGRVQLTVMEADK